MEHWRSKGDISPELARRLELREEIHGAAEVAAIQAGLIQTYAELGDDRGLAYAVQNYLAYTRMIIATSNDLVEMNNEAEKT